MLIISRTSFLQLLNAFTGGGKNGKSVVYYVLGALLYDNLRTAREILANKIDDEITKS